jgi:single-strand DNA-binding protein
MANDSNFSVAGYIATEPVAGTTPAGVPTLSMRLAWTPRRFDRGTSQWVDQASSFATVKCYRKLAEHAQLSLRKGEPVVVRGSLTIREYEAKDGSRRTAVDVTASSIGHDLSRGIAGFRRLRPSPEQPAAESAAHQEGEDPADAMSADHGVAASGLTEGGPGEVAPEDEIFDDIAEVTSGEPVATPF